MFKNRPTLKIHRLTRNRTKSKKTSDPTKETIAQTLQLFSRANPQIDPLKKNTKNYKKRLIRLLACRRTLSI